ncbi:MAG: trypsin-like peptidase domain-containing protein [Pseudomonadota bacterium]
MECDVCGVIFARYQKIQDRKKEAEALKESVETKSGSGLKLLQVAVLIVVVAATTYYFTVGNKTTPSSMQPPVEAAPVAKVTSVQKEIRVVRAPEPQTVRQQPAVVQGNTIEQARNATVSIETPWGTGSGFFVNKNYIVTNRHVVQFDEKKLAELRDNIGKDRRFFELEQEKIDQWKQQYKRLPQGPSRSQLAMIIDQHEGELKKVLPMLEEKERRLQKVDRKIQPSDIKIILADGNSYAANYVLVSPGYDLALMSLFSGDQAFISKPPAGSRLHQGDKIYAIGSPVGLRDTVTAGIFSGYRAQGKDGQVYLQTDAAINPGNSGGPLIDENGYARGVTTMILQNTEGIGFAIPIEKVYEEFNSSLY